MDHRRGRRRRRRCRRSPRRLCSSTSPKLKSHRPYASRVRTNMRARTIERTRRKGSSDRNLPQLCMCVCMR